MVNAEWSGDEEKISENFSFCVFIFFFFFLGFGIIFLDMRFFTWFYLNEVKKIREKEREGAGKMGGEKKKIKRWREERKSCKKKINYKNYKIWKKFTRENREKKERKKEKRENCS